MGAVVSLRHVHLRPRHPTRQRAAGETGARLLPVLEARDVRVGDVDERFLENMEKGVLYRVRR